MNGKQRKSWVEKHEKNMLPELRKAQAERESKVVAKPKKKKPATVTATTNKGPTK